MARARHQAGFTLMELMVTMAIAASLMGLGAGIFLSMGKRTAGDNALASVSGLLINVRNASSRFPAAIRIDPTTDGHVGTVTGMAQEVRQELHFDPRTIEGRSEPLTPWGIEGRDCDANGATVETTHGRVGGALRLAGGTVNCRRYAAYDVTDGLTVELWIKPDNLSSADLVTKGDALTVRLEGSRRIGVKVTVQSDHGPEPITESCEVPLIRTDRWTGVRVSYDRNELSIWTDDGFGFAKRGAKVEHRPLAPAPDADLQVGGYSGLLDDFRFAGVHSELPLRMPAEVTLLGDKPKTIYFVGGQLDPAIHRGSETISLRFAGRITSLEISNNGRLTVTNPPTPPSDEPGAKGAPGKSEEKE
jgi:prepilin-type N-terminal cleavage/methylation domain-containing protein